MAVRKIGKNYYIDYYVSGSRVRQSVGPSKREAQAAMGKIHGKIREGRYFDRKDVTPSTLGDLVDRYAETASRRRGWPTEAYHLDAILSHFGRNKVVHEITLNDVEAFQAARIKVSSRNGGCRTNTTINREVQVLHRLMNKAVNWNMTQANPVSGVTYLEESTGRTRILNLEEVSALLLASKGTHLRPVIVCALNTGMRKDEILGLLWKEVDLDRRVIYIPPERTKSGRGREVPINPTLLAALGALPRVGPFVFWGKKRIKDIRKTWAKICRAAGIEDFKFHDIRHTAVSYMIMAGVPMKVAGEIVGHTTTTMTERYAHLLPNQKHLAVDALPRWEERDAAENG